MEAPKLLIVGGGPVGVELAGEIIVDFPQKKVNVNLHVSILIFFFKFRFFHSLVGMPYKWEFFAPDNECCLLFYCMVMKVTIVTASSRLVEFLSPKASAKTLKWLEKKKVDVIFEDK